MSLSGRIRSFCPLSLLRVALTFDNGGSRSVDISWVACRVLKVPSPDWSAASAPTARTCRGPGSSWRRSRMPSPEAPSSVVLTCQHPRIP
jgi:hypothetical protein